MTRNELQARIAYGKAVTAAAAEARFMAIVREALGLDESQREHLACFDAIFPPQDTVLDNLADPTQSDVYDACELIEQLSY